MSRAQFSVLICVVVLSAILPTAIVQRFFVPHTPEAARSAAELPDEDEFSPHPLRLDRQDERPAPTTETVWD